MEIDGCIITNLVVFPRVETGFGKSWHIGPSLREVKLGTNFQMASIWGGRFELELSSLDSLSMDMWLEAKTFGFFKIRVGRFKIPFGNIQHLSAYEQPLLEVPMVTGNPKDFRDVGLMLHGEIWNHRIRYGIAVVTGSRDLAVDVNEKPDLVGSLRLYPLRNLGPWLEGLGVGSSFAWGIGPLRRGFRGRTMAGWTFVNPPSIRGEQLRWGADIEWIMPSLTLRVEYQWQGQSRDGLVEMQRVGSSMVEVGNLDAWVIDGFQADLALQIWDSSDDEGLLTRIEIVTRFENLHFGDGNRKENIPEGEVTHGPLLDSWVQGVSAGFHCYLGWGIRLTALYQGLLFGRTNIAPDFDSTISLSHNPPQVAHWTHHVFMRAQWAY